jgi:hypothetical protein
MLSNLYKENYELFIYIYTSNSFVSLFMLINLFCL